MRGTILIVDDDEMELALLNQIFEGEYNIMMARNGKDAIVQLNAHYNEVVIILLDLLMPVLNGYQVLQVLKSSDVFRDIPVAVITANTDQALEVSCYNMGAMAVIHKPFVAQVVRQQISNIVETYQCSLELKMDLNAQLTKLNAFNEHLIDAISNLVEFRDLESGAHIKRVKGLTRILAEEYALSYPDSGLTPESIDTIVRAAAIHDIGKIAIPDSILLKPGRLTEDERQVMMSHTTKGCEILSLLSSLQDLDQMQVSYDICRHHHERHDGNGYPDGLKGDEIPLSAQLVSVADVYDALTSDRVYKRAYSKEVSYNMILKGECGTFSPNLLSCLKNSKTKLEQFSDSCR